MNRIWRTIRSYILWTYERGSLQYDIMVTLILGFIFITPIYVNFKDKPVERTPHQTEIVVSPDGSRGFVYQVPAGAVTGSDGAAIRTSLERTIEPISGEVEIERYEAVRDAKGNTIAYRAWARRP